MRGDVGECRCCGYPGEGYMVECPVGCDIPIIDFCLQCGHCEMHCTCKKGDEDENTSITIIG
jgi:hypothetical protein